jgi:hypothetical protein
LAAPYYESEGNQEKEGLHRFNGKDVPRSGPRFPLNLL